MINDSLFKGVCLSVAGSVMSLTQVSAQEKPLNFIEKKIAATHRTKAIGHATQIKLALLEFESEYDMRPGEAAASFVDGGKAISANDCFRQLIQGISVLRSEAIFYAPSKISQRVDSDIGTKKNHFKQACGKGEVGFLYVDSPDSKSSAPVIVAPVLDVKSGKLDHRKYDGKAVVLYVNGSVDVLDIDPKSGKIMIKVNGKLVDMLSKENPAFRSIPKIRYPEAKEQKKGEKKADK